MAATVTLVEKTGAGGSQTDKTSGTIRFKNADDPTVDLVNPMVVPGSGTDYSFEKWLRLNFAGIYSQGSNVVAYSDGTNGMGTGVSLWAKAVAAYATPAEASATTGYTEFWTYTSGSPLALSSGTFSGTGEKGDHLVMICTVASTASNGVTTAETLTVAWDEI